MRPLDVNILSKTETWITSQVRACKAMHVALHLLTFFSPQSINHAIDFKMALCKLVHCLEFNGKVALSPFHLIHTRIHFFPIRITFIMSSYIIPGLISYAWPPKPQLISSLIHLFNPELPDPTPPALSFFSHLSPFIPANTVIDNNYLVLSKCSSQLCSFGETPIRGFQRAAARPENKAQNRPSRVYA